MSNDRRKSPFSDLTEGDEQDWDKALNAWELPEGAAPPPKDQPAAAPKPKAPPPPPPRPAPPPAPPAKRPEVPRPAPATPVAPPMSSRFEDVPRAGFDPVDDDEDDE